MWSSAVRVRKEAHWKPCRCRLGPSRPAAGDRQARADLLAAAPTSSWHRSIRDRDRSATGTVPLIAVPVAAWRLGKRFGAHDATLVMIKPGDPEMIVKSSGYARRAGRPAAMRRPV